MRIIAASEGAGALAGWSADPRFTSIDAHPFTGGFGRSYYPAVYGERRRDVSFAVGAGDRPLVVVPCSLGEGQLDWYGLPVWLHAATGIEPAQREEAAGAALEHIAKLIEINAVTGSIVEEQIGSGTLSPLGEACLARGWRATPAFRGECDLTEGEAGLRRGLRKRFRSLVNWGKRNLALDYVNGANADRALFDAYQRFHLAVAGRSTRPQASWDAMFDWIAAGRGELTLGKLDGGELVAATLVVDGNSVAYYASGVYDRERFDKPMAHFPMYEAILRAGMRGLATFEIGSIPQAGEASAKELAIGYFKRGFAGRIATSLVWKWARTEKPAEAGA